MHIVKTSIKTRSFVFEIAALVSIKLDYITFQALLGSYLYPREQEHLKRTGVKRLFKPQQPIAMHHLCIKKDQFRSCYLTNHEQS